jgi:hypothetical protein
MFELHILSSSIIGAGMSRGAGTSVQDAAASRASFEPG